MRNPAKDTMTRAELRRWARGTVKILDGQGVVEVDSATIVEACRAVLELTEPISRAEAERACDWLECRTVSAFIEGYRAGAMRKGRL